MLTKITKTMQLSKYSSRKQESRRMELRKLNEAMQFLQKKRGKSDHIHEEWSAKRNQVNFQIIFFKYFFFIDKLQKSNYSVIHISIHPSKELCSKMAPGVTPMMMPHPCPSASKLLRPFFKSLNFFIMEKWPVSEEFHVKVESLKFLQFYLMKFDFFQSFNFDLKFL